MTSRVKDHETALPPHATRSRSLSETQLRLPRELRADCAACCGLCCVVHPFDAAQGFGFDKPAHTPCALLTEDCRCSIHAERVIKGFPGCVVYDCYGAGQRVARAFQEISWRHSPQLGAQMFEMFTRVRSLHELLAMLTLAMAEIDDERAKDELRALLHRIEALCTGTPPRLNDVDVATARREATRLMRRTAPLLRRDVETQSSISADDSSVR